MIIYGKNTCVADSYLARVARQVANHGMGVLKAVLAINHPLSGHQRVKLIIDITGPGDPVEFACIDGLTQGAHHVPAKVA